jgi:CXXX repeat peptide maturase
MIKYLVVILEPAAASFCYYDVKPVPSSGLMPLELLRRVVDHAIRNGLHINFVHGDTPLPEEYVRLVESADHISIMPPGQNPCAGGTVLVIDDHRLEDVSALAENPCANIILRVGMDRLRQLSGMVRQLMGKFGRLNIILKDLAQFEEPELQICREQMVVIGKRVAAEYRKGNFIEISTLTDRIFLTNMNNCGAGIEHLTVAPDGRYYLCPAFYHEGSEHSLGAFGETPRLENSRLLELDYAPICRNCDAYHCKRCIYLNRKLTGEVNTPSRQQCRIAHLERDQSRQLLATLPSAIDGSEKIVPIPELDYSDPFEMLTRRDIDGGAKDRHFASLLSRPLEAVPASQLLLQIYQLDPGLLAKLKQMNLFAPDLKPKK